MRAPRDKTGLRSAVRAVLVIVAVLALGPASVAAAGPNDACLACHSDPAAKGASGKPIGVDAAKFAASVHGATGLPCTACHADVAADKIPHEAVKPVDCATCHDKAAQQFATSIHGKARAFGSAVAATCANCHGTHEILRSKEAGSRTHHANLERTCGACHGNDEVVRRAKLPGGNVVSKYHDSIHGQAVASKRPVGAAAPDCTGCHGAHDMQPKSNSASRVARANIPDTCGSCHPAVRATWDASQHGKLRHSQVLQAPGCNDCHTAHAIQRHDVPQWQLAVIGECGTCHAERLGAYRDTFHGQVTQLGDPRIATCASCHGAHAVLPKDNPLSKVSAENRLATCRTCHPKANANFAQYDPHPNRHKREAGPLLYYTGKFMDLLLLGVFFFFGAHTLLWFLRSLKAVRERRAPPHGEKR